MEKITEGMRYVTLVKVSMVKEKELPYTVNELDRPEKVAAFMQEFLAGSDREHLLVLSVDNAGRPAAMEVVSIGTLNETLAEPREIFKHAILANAAGIVIAHKHTSGKCKPSKDDINTTKRIKKAGEILGIPLQNHVIVRDGYYSFREKGLLNVGRIVEGFRIRLRIK